MPTPAPQASTRDRIYGYICREYQSKAISPTFEQIAHACACSTSTVWTHVQRLWRDGLLARKQGFWGNKYEPTQVEPFALDPMLELAYKAGLQRGWRFGCELDNNAYRRALEAGFNPHLSYTKEA